MRSAVSQVYTVRWNANRKLGNIFSEKIYIFFFFFLHLLPSLIAEGIQKSRARARIEVNNFSRSVFLWRSAPARKSEIDGHRDRRAFIAKWHGHFARSAQWWCSKRARFAEPLRKHNSHFTPSCPRFRGSDPLYSATTGRYVITQCFSRKSFGKCASRALYYTRKRKIYLPTSFYIVAYIVVSGAREIVRFAHTHSWKCRIFLQKDRALFLQRCARRGGRGGRKASSFDCAVHRPWIGPIFR